MLIGIDYGTKRTGIAVSDESETLAFPHDVWETTKNLAEEVAVFARERGASGIIVGESHDLAGNPNPVAKDIEKLVDTLQAHLPIPIQYEPEYFTSRQAARIQGREKNLDAAAAAVILQSFIDKRKYKKMTEEKITSEIAIDDVTKLDIRIGKITDAKVMEGADKLLVLSVDLGEERERTIVSGIRAHFPDPAVLIGREVPVVANLKPRAMRGVMSEGMILYVVGDDFVHTLEPSQKNVPPGTKVK
ncbi:MAG: Holliday junction resolvase RuvX [Patescibacteria group bacterium]